MLLSWGIGQDFVQDYMKMRTTEKQSTFYKNKCMPNPGIRQFQIFRLIWTHTKKLYGRSLGRILKTKDNWEQLTAAAPPPPAVFILKGYLHL